MLKFPIAQKSNSLCSSMVANALERFGKDRIFHSSQLVMTLNISNRGEKFANMKKKKKKNDLEMDGYLSQSLRLIRIVVGCSLKTCFTDGQRTAAP